MTMDMELAKTLLQMGAAGLLILAGQQFLIYMRQEREDRKGEREMWFNRIHSLTSSLDTLARNITEAIRELRGAVGYRCPYSGLDINDIEKLREDFHRRNEANL